MRSDNAMAVHFPPRFVLLLGSVLAIASLAVAATGARAAEAQASQQGNVAVEAEGYADEPDAGFLDFRDDQFGDWTAPGDDDLRDEGFVDVEEDMFNFDAEYGQDYDEQFVSDQTDYEYQQDANVFETDEAWFEDWFDDEE